MEYHCQENILFLWKIFRSLRYSIYIKIDDKKWSVLLLKKKNFNGATFSKLNSWESFAETFLINSKFAFQL